MSAADFEAFLARIYVDPEARAKFLADPRGEAQRAGLSEAECIVLENIDRPGLELAATSFARKRAKQKDNHGERAWLTRWLPRLDIILKS
jgi:hypothetical protein